MSVILSYEDLCDTGRGLSRARTVFKIKKKCRLKSLGDERSIESNNFKIVFHSLRYEQTRLLVK